MEISSFQPYSLNNVYNPYMLLHYYHIPENYVHWRENPESHVYSANLPGLRKEYIKVEVEDSRYMIIRTEAADHSAASQRRFMRKFRLPERVDVDGISAKYEDGVLTVSVPRRGFSFNLADLPGRQLQVSASAA